MSKYDDFDLDLTNVKSGDSLMKFTDTPTDRSCPEDSCNRACYSEVCPIYTVEICPDRVF